MAANSINQLFHTFNWYHPAKSEDPDWNEDPNDPEWTSEKAKDDEYGAAGKGASSSGKGASTSGKGSTTSSSAAPATSAAVAATAKFKRNNKGFALKVPKSHQRE
jgi:hypothetical protein